MEDLGGQKLPATFNSQFLWNREFSIRWDLTKNLHLNFQSATHAEIKEPYDERPINKVRICILTVMRLGRIPYGIASATSATPWTIASSSPLPSSCHSINFLSSTG